MSLIRLTSVIAAIVVVSWSTYLHAGWGEGRSGNHQEILSNDSSTPAFNAASTESDVAPAVALGLTDMELGKILFESSPGSLLAGIQDTGYAKIIVRVNAPFRPLGALPAHQALYQMDMISSAQQALLRELKGYNIVAPYHFATIPYSAMIVDAAALKALLSSSLVVSVEEDVPVPPTLDLSVPRIGASIAHTQYKGSGWAVAILDTGVNGSHPLLNGSVLSEACYSSNHVLQRATSICPGGVTDSTAPGSAMPYSGACPAGECEHGTHVAGIAAGREGVAGSPGPGVAPDAMIIAVQVFSRFDSVLSCGIGNSPCVMSYTSDQIKGLERIYALRDAFDISSVNMSLGGGRYYSNCDSDSMKPIIDNLRSAGIATVISSGNDGYTDSISAPGCISTAVSVGATTDNDVVASYSNSASFLSLLAPGSSINSSVASGGYESWNGTSMAAPHVTGSWALLKQANPGASVDAILSSLTATGLPIADSRNGVTKARINVQRALNSFLSPIPVPEALDASSLSFTFGGTANWIGQDMIFQSDGDAAQSGLIGNAQSSWMQTTIAGPWQVSFYWKVSSESGYDFLSFLVDGVEQPDRISGEVDWQKKTYSIPSGSHTLRWEYKKDGIENHGSDTGWVDKIEFSLASPCGNKPVQRSGFYYDTLQQAYNVAYDGDTLLAQALMLSGDLNVNRGNIGVTIRGGHGCDYSAALGKTTINGKVTISSGSLIAEDLIIQ